MPAVLCVVGEHKAGKTCLIEALVTVLQARGLRVGAVKHSSHSVDMDRVGKDTWRYGQAGARAVAICAPGCLALIKQVEGEAPLAAVAAMLAGDVDLVLAEGFSSSGLPRIEVVRAGVSEGLASPPERLVAVVGDAPTETPVAGFGFDEMERLADHLVAWLDGQSEVRVSLLVDGAPVALNRFASAIIGGAVGGMVSALRGMPQAPASIVVGIEVGRDR